MNKEEFTKKFKEGDPVWQDGWSTPIWIKEIDHEGFTCAIYSFTLAGTRTIGGSYYYFDEDWKLCPINTLEQEWSYTGEMRWENRDISNPATLGGIRTLQQRLKGSLGGDKWEDVPTVSEN